MPDNRLRRVVDGLSTDSMACAKLRCMNISMPPAASRRLRTVRAITALALAATLGGCATYDYVGSDSPGGYYRGQSRSTYPGYYGGFPDGYYDGHYGYPGGYYMPGYYYGGVYYYGGHRYYRPPPHRPDGDHDGGHDRPPPSGNPGGSRMPSPWRDLNRIGEHQQHRNDGPPPRAYGLPQGQPPQPAMRPPQPSGAPPARSQPSRPAILPGFHRPKEHRQEP